MQILKEKKVLGIRYVGRIGILIINAVLVLIFSNIVIWMKVLFSNINHMDYMDTMLEYHIYFDKQIMGIEIIMLLIGGIPVVAFFLMLCSFITSILKTRGMEEYLLYCLGYTKLQLMKRELMYIGFDTAISYVISVILFSVIINKIENNKYMILLQNNLDTNLEIYFPIYIVFAVILTGMVICRGKKIIENNLKIFGDKMIGMR